MNDTLPTSLTRFGDELAGVIARDLATPGPDPSPGHRPSPRRRMLASAVATCVVAGAAIAGITLMANGRTSDSAWDQHVLRAAEIALPKPAPNTILHVSVTQTMSARARHDTVSPAAPIVNAEGWFQQGGPSRSLIRETVPGGSPVWQSDTGVYSVAAGRVYVDPPLPAGHPRYTLSKSSRVGSYTLRVATPHGVARQTASAYEAHALRTGADQISWAETWNGQKAALRPMIVPAGSPLGDTQTEQPAGTSLSFPAQLHRALQSGRAQVTGRVTIDGRAAIEIETLGADRKPWLTYYVDPKTFQPIELDIYGADSTKDLTRLVFNTYQRLPIKGNTKLLRLPAPAGTPVERNATEYFRHMPALLFW